MEGEEPGKYRVRTVLLGSFYRGFYCLDELLHGGIADRIKVVGVATDKVTGKKFTWNEEGGLEILIKNRTAIKKNHKKAVENKKKLISGARLIDILRLIDPIEEADSFEKIMAEQEDEKACLICKN